MRARACCIPHLLTLPARACNAAIEVEIASELFVAKGLMIKERNYLEIYKYENWADKSIPVFVNGEAFRPTELTMTSGRTQVCRSRFSRAGARPCACARGFGSEVPAAMCVHTAAAAAVGGRPDPDDESPWHWHRRHNRCTHYHDSGSRVCRYAVHGTVHDATDACKR